MQKQPFSNEGFANLQATLYALEDVALQAEAALIANNFTAWMANHFLLDNSQIDFMQELAPQAIDFLASQTSIAVANRLLITLEKDEEEEEDKTGKVIHPKANFAATANQSGNFQVSGDLKIEIYYQS